MSSYPYETIFLNGREIKIQDILSNNVVARSEFESTSLAFINDWLREVDQYTIKTSGSTGIPKNITISKAQMTASAKATEIALGLKQGYRAFICLDTRFIAGKMMIVRSFVTGMKMELAEPEGNPFSELGDDSLIDFIALVPYQVSRILESSKTSKFNSIKTVIIGGAPLNQAIANELQGYRSLFYITYGMTETISHIALHQLNKQTEDGVFEILPGIKIDKDDRGCLMIDAPYLPEKVMTNDLVEIVSSTHFRWLGRWDNVINSGGVKVQPEKIEYQIEKIFNRLNVERSFFISGIPDDRLGQKVTLFIEGQRDDLIYIHLENRLKTILEPFERPKEIVFVPNFVFTPTNKLNRTATLNVYLRGKN